MDMQVPQPIQTQSASANKYLPPTLRSPGAERPVEFFFSDQLSAFMDADLRAMWLRWNPTPRPNFNPSLLQDLNRYCHFLAQSEGRIETNEGPLEFDYAVLSSQVTGVFNLGGDLNQFMQLIESQD